MKYSIVFSSKTGNTSTLAERVKAGLPSEDCLYYGAPSELALSAPVIFVGFWTDKGTCDAKTLEFIKTLHDKTVLLFGTAGFGGSEDYFVTILERVGENISDGNRIGQGFMCQGRMYIAVRQRFEAMLEANPDDNVAAEMIANFDMAVTHPNEADFTRLAKWLNGLKALAAKTH